MVKVFPCLATRVLYLACAYLGHEDRSPPSPSQLDPFTLFVRQIISCSLPVPVSFFSSRISMLPTTNVDYSASHGGSFPHRSTNPFPHPFGSTIKSMATLLSQQIQYAPNFGRSYFIQYFNGRGLISIQAGPPCATSRCSPTVSKTAESPSHRRSAPIQWASFMGHHH